MLKIDGLVKTFAEGRGRSAGDRVYAVGGVSFEVAEGEMFTLLGPSGCGKTTTLRSVAGLERPDEGRIELGGRVLFDHATRVNVAANRRDLGMVFQSYAIWPHLSVFKNVSFALEVQPRGRKVPAKEIEERVLKVLEVTELREYADRSATKLSGGQQQRLALARALVTRPDLVLLDEPLSNLDAKLRESMRFELKRLQRELGLTAVYVTHDQSEALVMSSRIAVLNDGRIEQVGKPREIYTNPKTRFVAEFIGTSNFVAATVAAVHGSETVVETEQGRLVLRGPARTPAVRDEVLVQIRPESVGISEEPTPGAVNEWRGEVLTRAFLGDSVDHVVGVGKLEIRTRSNPAVSIPPHTRVYVTIDPARIALVPLG